MPDSEEQSHDGKERSSDSEEDGISESSEVKAEGKTVKGKAEVKTENTVNTEKKSGENPEESPEKTQVGKPEKKTAEKSAAEKSAGKKNAAEKKKSPAILVGAILLSLILLGVVILYVYGSNSRTPGTTPVEFSDSAVINIAKEATSAMMRESEIKDNYTIDRDSAVLIREPDGYRVVFDINGSSPKKYLSYNVMLDKNLNLVGVSRDVGKSSTGGFVASNLTVDDIDPSVIRTCSRLYIEREVVPTLIEGNLDIKSGINRLLRPSRTLGCNGVELGYSLEITPRNVSVSINNITKTVPIDEGMVSKGVFVPEKDLSRGVLLILSSDDSGLLVYDYRVV